jgi:MFS superfamily sulfate permease-like transporter
MPWKTIFSAKNYTLPSLALWEKWKLILVLGYGSTLFMTEFTKTAIALNVVDSLDGSEGPGFLVLIGQGVANVGSGLLLGGMGSTGVVSMSVLAAQLLALPARVPPGMIIMFIFGMRGYPVIDFIPLSVSAVSGISVAMVCSYTIAINDSNLHYVPSQQNTQSATYFISASCSSFFISR